MTTVSAQRAPGLTRPAPTAPFVGRPLRATTTTTGQPPPRFTTTTTSTTTAPAPRLVVEKPVPEDYLREQARKKQQPALRGITTQVDLETAPPLTAQQEALIKRVHYDQKLLIGRDGLWHYMAGKYKNAPSQKQVGDWLRRQELAQIYQLPRKSGTVNSFIPPSKGPWHATSMGLVDFVGKPAGIRLYKCILVYIDNFSRYMICRPITSKSPARLGTTA